MSWWDPFGIFDPLFENPSDAALEMYSFEDMQEMLEQYYGPYKEAGLRALPTLEEQYMMLLNNPAAINQMLASEFETSPGYEYQYQQSMNAANQAAAAGGMSGTQQHQQYAASTAQGLASQDYWKYMNHMTDLYKSGLNVAGDINQMGYNASSAIAADLARFMGAQMGLSYQGAASTQQAMWGAIGAAAGSAMGPK